MISLYKNTWMNNSINRLVKQSMNGKTDEKVLTFMIEKRNE